MMTSISQVALLVDDYDKAIDFYCSILGFKVVEDTKMEKKRWVRIGLPDAQTELIVSKAANEDQRKYIGKQAGGRVFLFLNTDNFEQDLSHLRKHNVEILEGPRTEAYGKVLVFKDIYGNRIDLIEKK